MITATSQVIESTVEAAEIAQLILIASLPITGSPNTPGDFQRAFFNSTKRAHDILIFHTEDQFSAFKMLLVTPIGTSCSKRAEVTRGHKFLFQRKLKLSFLTLNFKTSCKGGRRRQNQFTVLTMLLFFFLPQNPIPINEM